MPCRGQFPIESKLLPIHPLDRLPKTAGTYALLFHLGRSEVIPVGSLGEHQYLDGYYIYVGSAQGPGGICARVNRHLRPESEKRLHWHIDRLLSKAKVHEIWWQVGSPPSECDWAESLSKLGCRSPARFGASDCRCPGHLIYMNGTGVFTLDREWQLGIDQGTSSHSVEWTEISRQRRDG